MADRSVRNRAPRERGTYSNAVHGRRESSVPDNDRTLNKELCALSVIRPKFKSGPLVFRAFPHLDYDKPGERLMGGRNSTADSDQSEWIVRVAAASYIGMSGCPKHTFLLYKPGDEAGKEENPYRAFYFAAKQAKKAGEFSSNRHWDGHWNQLLDGKPGEGAAISAPKPIFFVQGAVYCNGDKDFMAGGKRTRPLGLADGDDLVVIELPTSAGENLLALLDRKRQSYDGDAEEDPTLPFIYDAIGYHDRRDGIVEGGELIEIFNPRLVKRDRDTSFNPDVKKDYQGYEVALHQSFKSGGDTFKPSLDRDAVDFIFKKVQFWWDGGSEQGLLRVAPIEQQALWIAQSFRSAPNLVAWCWADHPEFLTEEVKGVLNDRVSGAIPDQETGDAEQLDERDDRDRDEDRGRGRRDVSAERDDDRRGRSRGTDSTQRDLFENQDRDRDQREQGHDDRGGRQRDEDRDRPRRDAADDRGRSDHRGSGRDDDFEPQPEERASTRDDDARTRGRRDEEDRGSRDRDERSVPRDARDRDEFANAPEVERGRERGREDDRDRDERPAPRDARDRNERPAQRDSRDRDERAPARDSRDREDDRDRDRGDRSASRRDDQAEEPRPRRAAPEREEPSEERPPRREPARAAAYDGDNFREAEKPAAPDKAAAADEARGRSAGRRSSKPTETEAPPAAPAASRGGSARRSSGSSKPATRKRGK